MSRPQGDIIGGTTLEVGPSWAAAIAASVRRRFHDLGLLPRLLIATALVLALVFSGVVLLVSVVARSLESRISQDRLLLGTAIAEDLDAALSDSIGDLQQFASGYQPGAVSGGLGPVQGSPGVLAEEAHMFTRGTLVAGPRGEVLGSDLHHLDPATLDLQHSWPSLWDHKAGAPSVQVAGIISEGQANGLVAIAVPVGGAAEEEYVIGLMDTADSYPAHILARAVSLGGSGHADIVDQKGIALFSTESQQVLRTSDHPASYRDLFREGESTIAELPHIGEAGNTDSGAHLMTFVPLKVVPWGFAMGTTVAEAFAPVRQLWYGSMSFLALLAGLAFGVAIFVSRRLVQPVAALSKVAKSVAEGNRVATVDIPWGGEIGELARSLETMRLRLQAWTSELEKQVHERTRELQQRNQELVDLYGTLQAKEEQLRTLLGKVLTAQEDERKRVSRELHDGIGQALSALSMGLERLEQARPGQMPAMQEHIETLKELAVNTLSDLRNLTVALRPAALDDLGLVPAIRRYTELHLVNAGVEFVVEDEGLPERLDPALETVVFRVAQEAINNIARHSHATQAKLSLQYDKGILRLCVEDNGMGFDPTLASFKEGVGLQGMQERASLVGGQLTVESHLGQGSKVLLEVPQAERMSVSGHG